jgi:hypothetical protein
MSAPEGRTLALDDAALGWAQRGVWVVCAAVYLTVFIGGIRAGGAELEVLGRAAAFTIAAAVLGRLALGMLEQASLPSEPGPTDDQEEPIGSLSELFASTNVAHLEDEAEAAVNGER